MVNLGKRYRAIAVDSINSFLEVKQEVKGQIIISLIRANHSKGWGAKPLV